MARPITSKIGHLDWKTFPRGIYTYTGSARGRSVNLHIRLSRHLRAEKKRRWHIDYLLSFQDVAIKTVIYYITSIKQECPVAKKIELLAETTPIIKGFGSSDCTYGCAAHLHHFPGFTLNEVISQIERIYKQVFSDYPSTVDRISINTTSLKESIRK